MINVNGVLVKSIKTMADRSVVATIDFGELVKLGDFDDILQTPIRVILVKEDDIILASEYKEEN